MVVEFGALRAIADDHLDAGQIDRQERLKLLQWQLDDALRLEQIGVDASTRREGVAIMVTEAAA
jgi:hypothetical protein